MPENSLRKKFFKYSVLLVVLVASMQTFIFACFEIFSEFHEKEEYWHQLVTDKEKLAQLEKENWAHSWKEIFLLSGIALITTPIFIVFVKQVSSRMLKPIEDIAHGVRLADKTEPSHAHGLLEYPHRDEIGTLVTALNQAFKNHHHSLEKARRFSADASHQLRTPLAVMRSTGELALDQERSLEGYREALHSMLEETERLEHVVEQLLLLSNLQDTSAESSFGRVKLDEILANIEDRYRVLAESHRIEWSREIPASDWIIKGNVLLLTEAVANLVDNAIHSMSAGGQLHLFLARKENQIEVGIKDSGPGIPPALKNRLFERFSRMPDSSYQGSGLGLPIVQAIIELHHAEIEVQTPPEGGTVFLLRFENPA